jgi:hypothetical protein
MADLAPDCPINIITSEVTSSRAAAAVRACRSEIRPTAPGTA